MSIEVKVIGIGGYDEYNNLQYVKGGSLFNFSLDEKYIGSISIHGKTDASLQDPQSLFLNMRTASLTLLGGGGLMFTEGNGIFPFGAIDTLFIFDDTAFVVDKYSQEPDGLVKLTLKNWLSRAQRVKVVPSSTSRGSFLSLNGVASSLRGFPQVPITFPRNMLRLPLRVNPKEAQQDFGEILTQALFFTQQVPYYSNGVKFRSIYRSIDEVKEAEVSQINRLEIKRDSPPVGVWTFEGLSNDLSEGATSSITSRVNEQTGANIESRTFATPNLVAEKAKAMASSFIDKISIQRESVRVTIPYKQALTLPVGSLIEFTNLEIGFLCLVLSTEFNISSEEMPQVTLNCVRYYDGD